uniref:Uncharacterized protein n=1 Tax=Oryza punctata TaxID=4537 RepID=A0A0E0JPN6_ORYPU
MILVTIWIGEDGQVCRLAYFVPEFMILVGTSSFGARLQIALQLDGYLDLGICWVSSCKSLTKGRRCVFDAAITLII